MTMAGPLRVNTMGVVVTSAVFLAGLLWAKWVP
jgi:hypothetical protein